ncbi:hypothetical protein J4439_04545 [Candidatus Woesearchaeota archaeon]|nr:hypothetical protein [Candidatus Woesearchaeota archaeon]
MSIEPNKVEGILLVNNTFNFTELGGHFFSRGNGTVFLDNTFIDVDIQNNGVNTTFCRDGVFNHFLGDSPIRTTTPIDLDPSCVWNLPSGLILEGFENSELDCRGALINGTDQMSHSGIEGLGSRNLTIRNCKVSHYDPVGGLGLGMIFYGGTEDLTIQNNLIQNTTWGIAVNFAQNNPRILVENNTFRTREHNLVLDVSDSIVRGNRFMESPEGDGLGLVGTNNVIEGNFFNDTPLHLCCSQNITIEKNTFRGMENTTSVLFSTFGPLEDIALVNNEFNGGHLALGDISNPSITNLRLRMEHNVLNSVSQVEIDYWNDTSVAFNNATGLDRGYRFIGGGNLLAKQNVLEGCVSCESAFFSRGVRNLTIEDQEIDGYAKPLDLGGLSVGVRRLLVRGGTSLFFLVGSAVVDSVFHATGISGNQTLYRNNTFDGVVEMMVAIDNTLTENLFRGASLNLTNTTRGNLLFANILDNTAVNDAGDNNTWCVNGTGNDYVAGASYTGNDHFNGTCPPPDGDDDGVPDVEDLCLGTVLPESVSVNPNHYADIDADGIFEMGRAAQDSQYTLADTRGCSCAQILRLKPGRDNGEMEHGCTRGTMENFIAWRGDL